MTPQSAKAKYLRPLNKYRHATSIEDYFNQRVIKHSGYYDSDCWQFNTKGDKDGYPQVQGSKVCQELGLTRAHQVSYYVHKGLIPKDKIVCHSCDTPWCVNPEHLFLGSWDDNVQDMMKKGRYKNPFHNGYILKISPKQKEEIKLLKGKLISLDVAQKYNISFSRVCQIWRGE